MTEFEITKNGFFKVIMSKNTKNFKLNFLIQGHKTLKNNLMLGITTEYFKTTKINELSFSIGLIFYQINGYINIIKK